MQGKGEEQRRSGLRNVRGWQTPYLIHKRTKTPNPLHGLLEGVKSKKSVCGDFEEIIRKEDLDQ